MTLKEQWKKFREFDNKGFLVERVEGSIAYTPRGYVIDRRIFQGYFLIVLLVVLYVAWTTQAGWREVYVHCPWDSRTACENPFYNDYGMEAVREIAHLRYLERGFTFGTPPDPTYGRKLFGVGCVVLFGALVAFAANHTLHNRGRPLRYLLRAEAEEEL